MIFRRFLYVRMDILSMKSDDKRTGKMRVGIIGGGAIGLLFAKYLTEEHEITIYTRSNEQAKLLSEEGLQFIRDGKQHTYSVRAEQVSQSIKQEDLLIVAVKQYHLTDLLPLLETWNGPILFVQNGMGHLEFMKKLAAQPIYVGVVEHGALKHNGNTVEHTGIGKTKLALFSGKAGLTLQTKDNPNFMFEFHEDYHQILIEKLVANAVINPLTAILSVPNGELVTNSYFKTILEDFFHEIAHILEIRNKEQVLQSVLKICEHTYQNRSSMLKDIENHRLTEIEAILGYILSVATQSDKQAVLTTLAYNIIKGKEIRRAKEA